MSENFFENKKTSKDIFLDFFKTKQETLDQFFNEIREESARVQGCEVEELLSRDIVPGLVNRIAEEMNRSDEQFKKEMEQFLKPKVWGSQSGKLDFCEQVFLPDTERVNSVASEEEVLDANMKTIGSIRKAHRDGKIPGNKHINKQADFDEAA